MGFAILIVNYRNLDDTSACLKSIFACEPLFKEVIVVDNASDDDSLKRLRNEFPSVTYLPQGDNLGFAEGNNVGIRYAMAKNFDGVLMLNNDTVVRNGAFLALVKAAKEHPGQILGGSALRMDNESVLDHIGGIWRNGKVQMVGLGARKEAFSEVQTLDYVFGACLYAPISVFKKIGLLDARFFLYWEEFDFCMRAKKVGVKSLYIPSIEVLHKGGSSMPNKRFSGYFFARNQLLWLEKNSRFSFWYIPKKLLSQCWKSFFYTMQRYFFPTKENLVKYYEMKGRTQGCLHYLRRRFGIFPNEVLHFPLEKDS